MSVQYRPTRLVIETGALENNLQAVAKHLNGAARMMAVVKADAYGHGAITEARLALKNGASMLAVALVEEGILLREAGIRCPILVLGGVSAEGARAAVQYGISQSMYDAGTLEVMQREAKRLNTQALVHLKIDTGMTRVGLRGSGEIGRMLENLKSCSNVAVEGVFTHFADVLGDREYTDRQKALFDSALTQIRQAGFTPLAHAAASTALLTRSDLWYDMVRPGIVLYGAEVNGICPAIRPAQRLTTKPVRLEWVESGQTVGYSRTFRAARKTLVMTLPIGYGDGYPRILSNRASVLVRGRRAPLIGNVCMDMIMADATDIPEVSLEDEVVLMGAQGGQRITPDELAGLAQTIPYEIMLGFTERIPRETE